jgi:indolepyruvate decarboxylase
MAAPMSMSAKNSAEESIGNFLLRRLTEAGLSHVFGVAGDFNLELLEQLEAIDSLKWIGCCNELNAAYAADGYARTHGLSALITTYGVGELSALCGMAGAYSEHLPVVAITGAPPLTEIERKSLLHHTADDGNFDNMMICARQFSVAQARVTPQNAVSEIDRCLRACILQKQPVYLQLPSDLAYIKIATPKAPISVKFVSDPEMLEHFVNAAVQRLAESSSVAILVDADVARFHQAKKVTELAEKVGACIAVMGTAKGVIDETNPNYIGMYAGAFSQPDVQRRIETSECLIQLGVRFIDSTTGSFTEHIQPERCIQINSWNGRLEEDDFRGICMADMLDRLVAAVGLKQGAPKNSQPVRVEAPPSSRLTQEWFWRRMAAFVQPGDIIVAENGTSLSGVSSMPLPCDTSVISQALWGAIGYTLPATFGSLLAAPERRHVLFIGDGSFQLTAQELSSILRHHLKPIIFLLNNDGYTIERLILGEHSSYNDVQPWKYAGLCDVFSSKSQYDSRRVRSISELENALGATAARQKCFFIEVMFDRMDAPDALKKLGKVYARQDYGRGRMAELEVIRPQSQAAPYDIGLPGNGCITNQE